jgi:4-diphosphocytidyl-2-C-methyl-D-erythritol kinase
MAPRLPHTEPAPAKLTVELHVEGVRPDGYHLLEAEMVTLSLVDRLDFAVGDGLFVVDEGAGTPVPSGSDNLVSRALSVIGVSASVTLHKRIPAGGGLGGGSADAAAVLRWSGRADVAELAPRLGADVPFCLRGGRARVSGVGERVEPLPFRAERYLVLCPPVVVATPLVYRAFDDLGSPAEGDNDLEPAALAVVPELAQWREALWRLTGTRPRLAGSGASWWVRLEPDVAEGVFPSEVVLGGRRGRLHDLRTVPALEVAGDTADRKD